MGKNERVRELNSERETDRGVGDILSWALTEWPNYRHW